MRGFVVVVVVLAVALWAPIWTVWPTAALILLYWLKYRGPNDPKPLPAATRQRIQQQLDEQERRR